MQIIPDTMLAWRLFGEGMDKFGVDNKPERIPVPPYRDDELLMKVEAIGLCFSDTKLINSGERHPRVVVARLADEPLIPGHEAVLMVVGVGKNLRKEFEPGQRYIIQADIYYHGINLAYGYAINGGMAQYSVMTEPILRGDAGCYLLPISDKLSAAEAALIEPWTCVMAAYRIAPRTTLQKGGILRIVGDGREHRHTMGSLLTRAAAPKRVILSNVMGRLLEEVSAFCRSAGVRLERQDNSAESADDLIVAGLHSAEVVGKLVSQLNKNGVFCLAEKGADCDVAVDIGRIHYENWRYVGTAENDIATAYEQNRRSAPKPGGVMWLPGGAGAMGQMHAQLAIESEQPPRLVVISDIDEARMNKLMARLMPKAQERNVRLAMLNPRGFPHESYYKRRLNDVAGDGFDDIVMLVPSTALLTEASKLLATDGVMNIFAGIPVGSSAMINLGRVATRGQRYVASSGSGMDVIRHTLEMTEAGKLSPVHALAAVGGMNALKEGISAVSEGRFPGKTVIYPHAADMPLTAVENIETLNPDAGAELGDGGMFTKAAEEKLRFAWERGR